MKNKPILSSLRARPVRHPAYLALALAPGEAAQVDWGCSGTIAIGQTRRRLSFFVMVLCHSRLAYVEFTCGESMEHSLSCHKNAFEFFGGTPAAILIDNLQTGVLRHSSGEKAIIQPEGPRPFGDFSTLFAWPV